MKFIELLQSRKFWAAVIGLILLGVQQYGHEFDPEQVIALVMVIVSYIVGTAIDPGAEGEKLIVLLKSRKFWAAVIGLVIVASQTFGWQLPITETSMLEIVVLLSSYIVGVAIEKKKPLQFGGE